MEMTFAEFLNWVIMGGGSVMGSSWILEKLAWFQGLDSEMKKLVSYASASVLGIGSYCLVTFAPEFVSVAQPYFMILAGTFVSIFLNNVFHSYDKSKKAG